MNIDTKALPIWGWIAHHRESGGRPIIADPGRAAMLPRTEGWDVFPVCRVDDAADRLAALEESNTLLSASLKKQDAQIERLEKDNARLQAELARVREALETLRVILLGRSADYKAMNHMIEEHSVPLSPFTHGPAQVRLGLEIIEDRLVALSQPAELDLSGAIRVMDKMANSLSGGDA